MIFWFMITNGSFIASNNNHFATLLGAVVALGVQHSNEEPGAALTLGFHGRFPEGADRPTRTVLVHPNLSQAMPNDTASSVKLNLKLHIMSLKRHSDSFLLINY